LAFDPFKDFETSGYLRNKFAEKDPQIVQELEHQMFRASLDEAKCTDRQIMRHYLSRCV
jgi:fido (protein-threonine AMPylation protein)